MNFPRGTISHADAPISIFPRKTGEEVKLPTQIMNE
jgi:hypothetical protein